MRAESILVSLLVSLALLVTYARAWSVIMRGIDPADQFTRMLVQFDPNLQNISLSITLPEFEDAAAITIGPHNGKHPNIDLSKANTLRAHIRYNDGSLRSRIR
jgi:hypothetical protein